MILVIQQDEGATGPTNEYVKTYFNGELTKLDFS